MQETSFFFHLTKMNGINLYFLLRETLKIFNLISQNNSRIFLFAQTCRSVRQVHDLILHLRDARAMYESADGDTNRDVFRYGTDNKTQRRAINGFTAIRGR